MVTSLAPLIGYDAAAGIAKEAYRSGRTVRQVALEAGVLSKPRSWRRLLIPGRRPREASRVARRPTVVGGADSGLESRHGSAGECPPHPALRHGLLLRGGSRAGRSDSWSGGRSSSVGIPTAGGSWRRQVTRRAPSGSTRRCLRRGPGGSVPTSSSCVPTSPAIAASRRRSSGSSTASLRLVQTLSLDEAFLDVSQHLERFGHATAVAQAIRRRVAEERRLTVSVGVGPNRLVAKIASDQDKPDGLTVIPPHRVLEFLAPLSVHAAFPESARRPRPRCSGSECARSSDLTGALAGGVGGSLRAPR